MDMNQEEEIKLLKEKIKKQEERISALEQLVEKIRKVQLTGIGGWLL